MYVKITKSGPRKYVQLVEAFRDENGKVKQKTIATLGRLDKMGEDLKSVVDGLLRITGQAIPDAPNIEFQSAKTFGDIWALTQLWNEIGFDQLRKVFRDSRFKVPVEKLIEVMVLNRMASPDSKLGVLRWMQTADLGLVVDEQKVNHQLLLRAMDALDKQSDAVNEALAGLIRPLVDSDLSVVFYDMTSITVSGDADVDDDIRHYGVSKDGGIRRQVMLGVVQTADGIPLYHEVFDGNTAEVGTFIPVIKKIVERYPVQRIVVVADRGLLSIDNLDELQQIQLPSGNPIEFILAVPGRRYKDFGPIMDMLEPQFSEASEEVVIEAVWNNLRLIVAHDPTRAREQTEMRRQRISDIENEAKKLADKLDRQDAGASSRGRKLSDGGATAKMYRTVSESHLAKIIKVDLKSDLFTYTIDEDALKRAEQMDGKLLLITNVSDLEPKQIVKHYKSLADIERGFRVLKSDLEIGPIYHRLPKRIKAHATICFMALVMTRILRQRLKANNSNYSPSRALWKLRQIQTHQTTINHVPFNGISTADPEQLEIFSQLGIERPNSSHIQPM